MAIRSIRVQRGVGKARLQLNLKQLSKPNEKAPSLCLRSLGVHSESTLPTAIQGYAFELLLIKYLGLRRKDPARHHRVPLHCVVSSDNRRQSRQDVLNDTMLARAGTSGYTFRHPPGGDSTARARRADDVDRTTHQNTVRLIGDSTTISYV